MPKETTYWTSVCKRIFLTILTIIAIVICFKLACFYMPFVIAFIISLIVEPLIKKLMNKFKITRRLSAIIVFVLTFGIIIGLLIWGITTIISESADLLSDFNDYYMKAYDMVQNLLSYINFDKLNMPTELLNIAKNSSVSLLDNILNYLQEFLTKIVTGITSIPSMGIYLGVTILALYFICTDKIYMLDELEHHLPEKWMKELSRTHKRISKSFRGIFKSTNNIDINIIYNLFNRIVYIVFCRTKCGISFNNCTSELLLWMHFRYWVLEL